jgi:hypothetical protein
MAISKNSLEIWQFCFYSLTKILPIGSFFMTKWQHFAPKEKGMAIFSTFKVFNNFISIPKL